MAALFAFFRNKYTQIRPTESLRNSERERECMCARTDFGIPAEIHYASDRDIQTERGSPLSVPLKQHTSSNRYGLGVIWESVLRGFGWMTVEGPDDSHSTCWGTGERTGSVMWFWLRYRWIMLKFVLQKKVFRLFYNNTFSHF